MNFQRLTGEYSTNTFSPSNKGIEGGCFYQLFYRNKYFFGTDYGISTLPSSLNDTPTFLDKYAHWVYYAYEVAFGIITNIIQFMHYTIWDPVYYYDSEEKYPSNKNHLVSGSEYRSIYLS